MKLSTQRIYLRPITEEDTDMVLRWRNSDAVKQFFIYQRDITKADHLHWFHSKVCTGQVYQFIIYTQTGKPIGSVYIQNVDQDRKQAEYGIFIGDEQELGKSYGTDAARLMVHFAFHELKLKKLYLRVLADNERAIRSYSRVGFVRDKAADTQVDIDGRIVDIVFMNILQEAEK